MQTKAIDLGYEYPERAIASAPPEETKSEKHYPSLYISNCPELMGLEDGEAIITYKVVSRTESERKGKEDCSLELEITSIKPKNMPAPESEGESDTEAAFAEYEGAEK